MTLDEARERVEFLRDMFAADADEMRGCGAEGAMEHASESAGTAAALSILLAAVSPGTPDAPAVESAATAWGEFPVTTEPAP